MEEFSRKSGDLASKPEGNRPYRSRTCDTLIKSQGVILIELTTHVSEYIDYIRYVHYLFLTILDDSGTLMNTG